VKILHCCLSCFYIDDQLYQENELVREHLAMGHDVRVLASTEVFAKDGTLTYTAPAEYMGSDGALVKRLPYRRFLPHVVMKKLRLHPGVYREIEAFAPDLIMFHGCCGFELRTVARYLKSHPNVHFVIDSHEDANNSAQSLVSRAILHDLYYGFLLRRYLPPRTPIRCISLETIDFVHDRYGIERARLEFYPLGGRPLADHEYRERRHEKRAELGLADDEIMFLQSGKFDSLKRLVLTLRAFVATSDPKFRLCISGKLMAGDDRSAIDELMCSDPRIRFLGWNSSSEMVSLLAAADVYLQPGSQSVTMQNSICQRCAIVIDNVKSHRPYVDGNGFLTNAGTDLLEIFGKISGDKGMIIAMGERSYAIAREMLDYRMLARKILPTPSDDRIVATGVP